MGSLNVLYEPRKQIPSVTPQLSSTRNATLGKVLGNQGWQSYFYFEQPNPFAHGLVLNVPAGPRSIEEQVPAVRAVAQEMLPKPRWLRPTECWRGHQVRNFRLDHTATQGPCGCGFYII